MLTRSVRWLLFGFVCVSTAGAQTIDDGFLLPKKTLLTGVIYAHDSWSEYWEGTLKRSNGNIGTLTTNSVTTMLHYGVTDRFGIIALLPYISTHASQGVLHDEAGFQDLSLTAKFRLIASGPTSHGALSAFIVGTGSLPISDYTPDFYPLSIGSGGGRAAARATVNYQSNSTFFATLTSSYTFCANVKLNRNSYYTNGQLYLTNEVEMPNVLENQITAGYTSGKLRIPISLTQQRTLGGSDIRRQDMPFVSNRMDFVRLEGGLLYSLPKNFGFTAGVGHVLNGRNVGESTTFRTGLFYALHF
jgi:hypothetical protein